MKEYSNLGAKIREIRAKSNRSLSEISRITNINRTYLSKIENGHERPSPDILNRIISFLGINYQNAYQLWELAGYTRRPGFVIASETVSATNKFKFVIDHKLKTHPRELVIVYELRGGE